MDQAEKERLYAEAKHEYRSKVASVAARDRDKSPICRNKHDKRIVGVIIRKDGSVMCQACERERQRRYRTNKKEGTTT